MARSFQFWGWAVLIAGGLGGSTALSASDAPAVARQRISVPVRFIALDAPDYLQYSNIHQRPSGLADLGKMRDLLADANQVWRRCGVEFEFTEFSIQKLDSIAALRPDDAEVDGKVAQILTEASTQPSAEELRLAIRYVAAAELLSERVIASVLRAAPEPRRAAIPIVLVPSVTELFVGETTPFGMTLPTRYRRDFLRKLLRAEVRPGEDAESRNPESMERIASILYGFDSVEQLRQRQDKGLSGLSLTEAERRAGLDYYSVLAHEFGHLFQLSHEGDLGEDAMGGESNFLKPEQCRLARARAPRLLQALQK